MLRRALLEKLVSPSASLQINDADPIKSLQPYAGPWTKEQAAHLLRRTTFGPTMAQIEAAVTGGLDDTIAELLDESQKPSVGPLNPGRWRRGGTLEPVNDPVIEVGKPWVFKEDGVWKAGVFDRNADNAFLINQSRRASIGAWKTESILKEGVSIYEKMTLFWHNHFVTGDITNPFRTIQYITTLSDHALGNYRELAKLITVDPAMLEYLNGSQNTRQAPNENYARELFELFTIGKGPLAGPGDYTFYTEDDIAAASKVLTGWRFNWSIEADNRGLITLNSENSVVFRSNLHDATEKQFSERFENQVIADEGAEEYETLVNMIFQQDECARFICRKLYRWFVYYEISDEVEQLVIEPMAQILLANDYEIKPALTALLKSEHFFDVLNLGPMIKNPYDFVTSILKPFNYPPEPDDLLQKLFLYRNITELFVVQQMTYFSPPDVAGWKAYYQAPLFYRTWINSSTLNLKMNITRLLTLGANQNPNDDSRINVLQMAANIEEAIDPNKLIDGLAERFFPQPITTAQKDYLKGILIPGLPDFEWSVEYGEYLEHPEDDDLRISVEQKLRQLTNAVLSMPEFYLS